MSFVDFNGQTGLFEGIGRGISNFLNDLGDRIVDAGKAIDSIMYDTKTGLVEEGTWFFDSFGLNLSVGAGVKNGNVKMLLTISEKIKSWGEMLETVLTDLAILTMIVLAALAIAVLVADDAIGIGVFDDPLIAAIILAVEELIRNMQPSFQFICARA